MLREAYAYIRVCTTIQRMCKRFEMDEYLNNTLTPPLSLSHLQSGVTEYSTYHRLPWGLLSTPFYFTLLLLVFVIFLPRATCFVNRTVSSF